MKTGGVKMRESAETPDRVGLEGGLEGPERGFGVIGMGVSGPRVFCLADRKSVV